MATGRKGHVPVRDATLFVREIGQGPPTIVLHGGPDFDHRYLLPEMDRLADMLRLIYYDQRGRGLSAPETSPEEVTLASEMEDLDAVRERFGFERAVLLGHSWGGLLAMEYAIRHPSRVSRLILMNSAPASYEDVTIFRQSRAAKAPADLEAMRGIAATVRYQSGDRETDAEYYRHHFRSALHRAENVEPVVRRLRLGVDADGVRRSRAIENRLYEQTWNSPAYDLKPALGRLDVPALVVHGESDFIPLTCSERIARAFAAAHLVVLSHCGHFAYLEQPEEVHRAVSEFLAPR